MVLPCHLDALLARAAAPLSHPACIKIDKTTVQNSPGHAGMGP